MFYRWIFLIIPAAIAAVLEQLKALPAVQAATASYGVPLRWDRWDQTVVSTEDRLASAGIWTVGDDYFATLRIPLVRGQQWTTGGEAASSRTVSPFASPFSSAT